MGGLLMGLAGGLKGLGDGMVEKAKADRQDAIMAWLESNKRTDMGTEHRYQGENIKQQGDIQSGIEDKRIGGEKDVAGMNITARHADVATEQAGANQRTSTEQTGANARNAATEAGANERNLQTTQATRDVANIRASSYDRKTDSIATQYGSGKAITYNQALQTARQAYKDQVATSGPVYDDDGTPIPADQAIADIADKLMSKGTSTLPAPTVVNQNPTGGGLLNPSGAAPMPSLPVTPITVTPAASPLTAPSFGSAGPGTPGGDSGWLVQRMKP